LCVIFCKLLEPLGIAVHNSVSCGVRVEFCYAVNSVDFVVKSLIRNVCVCMCCIFSNSPRSRWKCHRWWKQLSIVGRWKFVAQSSIDASTCVLTATQTTRNYLQYLL